MSVTSNDTKRRQAELIDQIKSRLDQAARVMVVSHIDPDGDALGTQLSFGRYLRDLGKEVLMLRDSDIPQKYLFLPDVDSIVKAESVKQDVDIDTCLVLECPGRDRIGTAARFLDQCSSVINIDHHQDGGEFGDINWVDASVSSVGEMAFELFQRTGYRVGTEVATQLYTAILTDTGRFRYSSTSPRTMAIAGELIGYGADPRVICNHVYYDMPATTMLLTGAVLNSIKYIADGRICLMSLTRKMLKESGADDSESEGLVDFTLFTIGVTTGALIKEIGPDRTKVSLRSSDGVDVARIAASLGGGGHRNAAGCEIALPLNEAREKISELLQDANGKLV